MYSNVEKVAFVIFLMAVPLSHCNTLRNAFTEEDLTPIVENLKWDDKEEQTAMADSFHQERYEDNTSTVCNDMRSVQEELRKCCPNGCHIFVSITCKLKFCGRCKN
nr:uncharacterized protein LOC131796356 [Pocillopora verrucosa]